jgi:hypothetical protein
MYGRLSGEWCRNRVFRREWRLGEGHETTSYSLPIIIVQARYSSLDLVPFSAPNS